MRVIESTLNSNLSEVHNSEAVLREYARPKFPKWEQRDKSKEKQTYLTSFNEDLETKGRNTYYAPPEN